MAPKPCPTVTDNTATAAAAVAAAIVPPLVLLPLLTQQLVALGLVIVLGLGFNTWPDGHTKGAVLVPFVVALAQVKTTYKIQQPETCASDAT
jgi:hypothetical protein